MKRMQIINDKKLISEKSMPVSSVEEAKEIISSLEKELDKCSNGLGLAAIQIGIPKRVGVIKPDKDRMICLINPEIVELSEEFIFPNEGCLSFPKKFINTKRYKHVIIKNQVIDGESFREETQYFYYNDDNFKYIAQESKLVAIAVQHELDHFEGKTIEEVEVKSEPIRVEAKIGRNDPCPCGSGKKYKKCCLGKVSAV